MKNIVERADKDKNKEVSIEEILTFDDFEFIESALPVVLMMINPGESLYYLVRLQLFNFFLKESIFLANISLLLSRRTRNVGGLPVDTGRGRR